MKSLLSFAVAAFAATVVYAAPKAPAIAPVDRGYATINEASARAHIGFLAADEMQGREAGTIGGRLAANYIESQFRDMGLSPAVGDSSYRQPFTAMRPERQRKGRWQVHPDSLSLLSSGVHQQLELCNILGKIEGKNPDEAVIIGAHYDHLGVDPTLSGDMIYNGADDNASGVAAVLQIARAFLASGVRPERTVIFALWDGEEKGLLGSEYFVQSSSDISSVKGYINFDMIGRNNREDEPQHVVCFYTQAYPVFEQWTRDDISARSLRLKPDYRAWDRPVGGGDQGSFAKRDVPIIWYHTDWHPDYHLPSDHAPLINWDKTVEITRSAFLNLWHMANDF